MRFCCVCQKQLLQLAWPETALEWEECREERDSTTGQVIWRGLRVRMGMAFGSAEGRKPLNTGDQSLQSQPAHRASIMPLYMHS